MTRMATSSRSSRTARNAMIRMIGRISRTLAVGPSCRFAQSLRTGGS
jgi:hypothetical protein